MPELIRDAATLHYEILGTGRPLLLLAGIASDGASWGPLLPLLQEGFRLIVLDNRGSGQTRFEGTIRIDDMVEDVVGLLDHLELKDVLVLGHSMGGMLALRLAARRPELVGKLITMTAGNVPGAKERVLFRDMVRLYRTLPPEDWFRLLFQFLFSTPFFVDEANIAAAAAAATDYAFRQSPDDFERQVRAVDDMTEIDVAGIACPVLAIAAELDLLVPPLMVAAAHAAIPDHEVTTIEDAAHSVHWEKPAEVAAAVREFFA
jgi:pimeloyl-ACP methyl ester carboxylesterase